MPAMTCTIWKQLNHHQAQSITHLIPRNLYIHSSISISKHPSCTFRYKTCTMLAQTHTTPISCNFPSLNPQNQNPKHPFLKTSPFSFSLQINNEKIKFSNITKRVCLQICQDSLKSQKSKDPDLEKKNFMEIDGENGGNGGGGRTTSFLIFLLWGGLMYYVLLLAPNQTPSTDLYLVKKLSFLIGDDGFKLNQVIVSLWNMMGLWPILYSMLLIPSGRSSKGNVPVFPFLILSFFAGAYALIPYFVLWRPPPPVTEESELNKWPLNFLESKLTAGVIFAVGLGSIVNAGLATGDNWKEYIQYFGGSRLIHGTGIDFALLSSFAPFWVYNDMTSRNGRTRGFGFFRYQWFHFWVLLYTFS